MSHNIHLLAESKTTDEEGYCAVRKVLLEYEKNFCNAKEKKPRRKVGKDVNRQFSEGADRQMIVVK